MGTREKRKARIQDKMIAPGMGGSDNPDVWNQDSKLKLGESWKKFLNCKKKTVDRYRREFETVFLF